jgi:hypothetical protein
VNEDKWRLETATIFNYLPIDRFSREFSGKLSESQIEIINQVLTTFIS